jgi:hypothetical protein
VDVIAADNSARLVAQRLDARAVVGLAYRAVNVIVFDAVVLGGRRRLVLERLLVVWTPAAGILFAPTPADRNAATGQVTDLILSNGLCRVGSLLFTVERQQIDTDVHTSR